MTFNDNPIEYKNRYKNALPPDTLLNGKYKVKDVLGQGSFGITYLVVTPDDQQFAIKEYFHQRMCYRSGLNVEFSRNAQGAEEVINGLKDFTNEAANLARIYAENQRLAESAWSQGKHDLLAEENYNIVRVVESFEANQTSYLVMEYLDGGNLLQMLKKPMMEEMATSIIIPIAWAVQHLHDNHIMHKDIKPGNIMMRSGNLPDPKLIDFGATLHYDRSGKLTTKSIGTALGTDSYRSLEHGATSRFTPHLDVYSLGATLLHMVTGTPRAPWSDYPQPEMVMNSVRASLLNANVSERLSQAILQAMDNNPNNRTQTAREFIENLNSPYLPLGAILESPRGNRYRIIGVLGQDKDYLSYKAERLLKNAPASNIGTVPVDKLTDGLIYTVYENFAKGICRRSEDQRVTSNKGHWPKQDYLADVKESTGLVKIPGISRDKQGVPLAEMFAANGTIYCIKRKKSGLFSIFSRNKQATPQQTKNKQIEPSQKLNRWLGLASAIFGIIALSFIVSGIVYDHSTSNENNSSSELLDTTAVVEESNDSLLAPIQKLLEDMVYVEGGTFTMGIEGEWAYPDIDLDRPSHKVSLSSFHICRYEVTNELWDFVMGTNLSKGGKSNIPVGNVSWIDSQRFIDKLNEMTQMKFRLPTEAEWEYAARGGKKSKDYIYSGSDDIIEVANSWVDTLQFLSRVGSMKPNELGIFDMSGNVFEWCEDWFSSYSQTELSNPHGPTKGNERVVRGGSYLDFEEACYVWARWKHKESFHDERTGFRLAHNHKGIKSNTQCIICDYRNRDD